MNKTEAIELIMKNTLCSADEAHIIYEECVKESDECECSPEYSVKMALSRLS